MAITDYELWLANTYDYSLHPVDSIYAAVVYAV